jgi:leucyl-tRNA synthetase
MLPSMLVPGDEYSPEMESAFHKAIRKVTNDIETLKFNTAIATLMALSNDIFAAKKLGRAELRAFLLLLCPFAPHICEELWEHQGFGGLICQQKWPEFDEDKCREDTVEIAVQINGKIRARMDVDAAAAEADVVAAAKANPEVAPHLAGKTLLKEIYVSGKLCNFVVN